MTARLNVVSPETRGEEPQSHLAARLQADAPMVRAIFKSLTRRPSLSETQLFFLFATGWVTPGVESPIPPWRPERPPVVRMRSLMVADGAGDAAGVDLRALAAAFWSTP